MRWSLRAKILTVLSVLLIGAVFTYLVLAERVFREDKELLVFDTNRGNAERLATELDGSVKRVADKMQLLAQLIAATNPKLAEAFFEQDPDLLIFQLVLIPRAMPQGKRPPEVREFLSRKKPEALSLKPGQLHSPAVLPPPESLAELPTPDRMQLENRSLPGAVLYLLRLPIQLEPGSRYAHAYARAVIDGRGWLEAFRQGQNLSLTFSTTDAGTAFIHPQTDWVTERRDLSSQDIVRAARAGGFLLQQAEYEIEGKRYLGVYRKTALGGLTVYSMTDRALALAASRILLEKTIILSLIVVTAVFLISLFFASSLSTPLLRLVRAAEEIGRGNFDTPLEVATGDEIETLSEAFGKMARELKNSRSLLEGYSADLERKVTERTQELEQKNADIRTQQEVLLRTTRLAAVGETAGQAAHEVLNPLTSMISRLESVSGRIRDLSDRPSSAFQAFQAILGAWTRTFAAAGPQGLAELLSQPSKVLPGKTLGEEDLANLATLAAQFDQFGRGLGRDLSILLSEAARIGRILDGMRSLSRASKFRTRFDLVSIVRETVRVNDELFARHGIRTETNLPPEPTPVYADVDEMRQVLSNLMRNSMDAIRERQKNEQSSRPGQVRIGVKIGNGQVIVQFRDNGAGIAAADRDRIFDPDFSTKGPEGTGFGLSICRRLIRAAGGEIILAGSELNQFTEFTLSLPMATESEHATTS